jgi:hypothetical protein
LVTGIIQPNWWNKIAFCRSIYICITHRPLLGYSAEAPNSYRYIIFLIFSLAPFSFIPILS